MTERRVSSERVSEERLREIIAGCEGVTPGPWRPSTWGFQIVSDYPEAAWQSVVELRVKPQKYPERASSEEAASQEAIAYHLARLDPATVKAMASELLALRSSVKTVRAHKHTCANVQPGSTYADKCDCGALDTAGNAIEIARPSPAAASEVTDSMVQKAWEAYDAKSGYSKPERFRAALTAALKGDRS